MKRHYHELPGLSRRQFLRYSTVAGAGLMASKLPLMGQFARSTLPSGVLFGVIGDFGEADATLTFPVDRVAKLIKSWQPDFIVGLGDDNYLTGEAETIDVNVGKNFNEYIYPKGTDYPVKYDYPPDAPLYNRFLSCLGNHDYADIADDFLPSPDNIKNADPFINYFTKAFTQGTANHPNTTITFANNIVGQTYEYDSNGEVTNFQTFQESTNVRVFDVRLGTDSGKSAVHLFFCDSNPATPYGRSYLPQPALNKDESPSGHTIQPAQADWIKARMAASDATWKIVIFHHPPYNSGPDAENQYLLERWPFEEWGASAVLTAHVHNYERLEAADPDVNGAPKPGSPKIPYFVCGSGGFVPEDGFSQQVLPESQVRVTEYGAMMVSADNDSISFLYFDIDGVLRDTFTLWSDSTSASKEVQFASNEYPTLADSSSITVTVRRTGNLSSALTVNYATADGTAKAGVNYVDASGQLHFNAGQAEQTITISLIAPTFSPGETPWESLIFSVMLSSPESGTTLGFFNSTTVLVINNVATPLNNTEAFVSQTYEDVFMRTATSEEITTAVTALGDDTPNDRASWLLDLMLANYSVEPVFPVAQIFGFANLTEPANLAGVAFTPAFPNLDFWVEEWRTGDFSSDNERLQAVSTGFNANTLEAVYYESSEYVAIRTNNPEFITAIYETLVLSNPISDHINLVDLAYWEGQLFSAADQQGARNLMMGRLATESFNPPPLDGMHAFNLPASERNKTLLSILISGLLRTSIDYNTFLNNYLNKSGAPNEANQPKLLDVIASILRSPTYANRFTRTSMQAWIDLVKGNGLDESQRHPLADPEQDGLSNLEEFAYAIPPGNQPGSITEIRLEDEGTQEGYVIYTYREARNIQGVELRLQTSLDMVNWQTLKSPQVIQVDEFSDYRKRIVRIPHQGAQRMFVRVVAKY